MVVHHRRVLGQRARNVGLKPTRQVDDCARDTQLHFVPKILCALLLKVFEIPAPQKRGKNKKKKKVKKKNLNLASSLSVMCEFLFFAMSTIVFVGPRMCLRDSVPERSKNKNKAFLCSVYLAQCRREILLCLQQRKGVLFLSFLTFCRLGQQKAFFRRRISRREERRRRLSVGDGNRKHRMDDGSRSFFGF